MARQYITMHHGDRFTSKIYKNPNDLSAFPGLMSNLVSTAFSPSGENKVDPVDQGYVFATLLETCLNSGHWLSIFCDFGYAVMMSLF